MNIVFLPGASGGVEFWHPLLQYLKAERAFNEKIVAYPSFGTMPHHPDVTDFTSLMAYVVAQIPENSIVVAQSMGGIFAVQAALQPHKKIKALILVATSGGISLNNFAVADWRQDYQISLPDVPDWFVHAQINLQPELQQIKIPIFLIWGTEDQISPVAVGEYLRQQFQQATLHIVQGGQHDLAEQYAEQIAPYIGEFIVQHHLG